MNIEQIRQQAQDRNTPPEILEQLINSGDKLTCKYVASNPISSIKILNKLCKEFPNEVFNNPQVEQIIADKSQKIPINLMIEREKYWVTPEEVFNFGEGCEDSEVWAEVLEPSLDKYRKQARDKTTSPFALAELAKNKDKLIRQYIASNPNTTVEVLEELGAKFPEEVMNNPVFELIKLENPESKFIQLSEARSQTISAARLYEIAGSSSRKVGEAVAGNPKTTMRTLEKLLKNKYEKKQSPLFYSRIIHHSNSSPEIIDAVVCQCQYASIIESALKCAKVSAKTLEAIAYDKNVIGKPQNFALLLKHPHISPKIVNIAKIITNSKNVSPEALKEFAYHKDPIAKKVFQHQNMSEEILAELSLSDYEEIKISVAQHPRATLNTLKYLTKDTNKFVRETIAQRDNIPKEILTILAEDPSESVRILVAEINNLAPETILKLASDPSEAVSCITIENHHNLIVLNPGMLLQLARNESKFIRSSVAFYQKLSAEFIELFAFDLSLSVRHGLVCDRNYYHSIMKSHLPIDILQKMLEQSEASPNLKLSPPLTKTLNIYNQEVSVREHELLSERVINFYIKIAIAKHPETPLDFLMTLIKDEDERIRAAAASSPNLSATILDKLMEDESRQVRFSVLDNPRVGSDTLQLYLEKNQGVRSCIGGGIYKARQQLRQRKKTAICGMANLISWQKSLDTKTLIHTCRIVDRAWKKFRW